MKSTLILASSSPRRQALLNQVNIPFTIRKPNIDESKVTTSDPVEKVKQLAVLKGRAVPIQDEGDVILAADTVVYHKQSMFEKPNSKDEAFQMITSLSGDVHDVLTGVLIRSAEREKLFVERTQVEFWPLSEAEIEWYVETKTPYDKAGAYGIQDLGAIFVKQIIGDYYNVVGLPISRVVRELRRFSIYPEV